MQPQSPYGPQPPLPGQGNGQPQPVLPGQQPAQMYGPQVQGPYPQGVPQMSQPYQPMPAVGSSYPQAQQPYGATPNQPYGQAPQQPMVPQYQVPANLQQHPNDKQVPNPKALSAPETPYDFFMKAPAKPLRKTIISPAKANNKTFRIVLAAAAIIMFLIIATIFQALLPKDTSSQEILTIAQTQAEVARVADLGIVSASASSVKSYAVNANLTIISDENALLAYMKKNHIAYKTKQLAALRSAKTDASLTAAKSSSTYDSTFTTLFNSQLSSYLLLLKQRLANSTGPKEHALLNASITHVTLLQEQIKEN